MDNNITLTSDNGRRDEIIREAVDVELRRIDFAERPDMSKAIKFPLAELTALGTAFSVIPEAFRTVTQTIPGSGEVLYRATDAVGNVIVPNAMQRFSDGSGLLGSGRIADSFTQFRFHPVVAEAQEVTTVMPIDPATLMIAAALMQVNQKLDAIQETQKEMFEYCKRKDRAEQKSDVDTLVDVMNNFKFNWDNEEYKRSKLVLVQGIRKNSRMWIHNYQDAIAAKLSKRSLLRLGKDAKEKSAAVAEDLKNYQVALYTFSLSSFLEVLLIGNFDANYLDSISESVDEQALQYRNVYTRCIDCVQDDADAAVESRVLGGLSFLGKKTGALVEKSPIGDRVMIDEALQDASKRLDSFNEGMSTELLMSLIVSKSDVSLPFKESIDRVNYLYNQPMELLVDCDNVYLLPVARQAA